MNIAARPEPPVLVEHAQTVRYALEETSHSLCRTPPKTNSQMIQEFERSHNSRTELIPALLARRTGAEVRRCRYYGLANLHRNRGKPNATRFQVPAHRHQRTRTLRRNNAVESLSSDRRCSVIGCCGREDQVSTDAVASDASMQVKARSSRGRSVRLIPDYFKPLM